MTYGEKKRFLEGYCSSVRRIKGLQRELDEWYTIATNVTQKITPTLVKNSDNQSKVENCAVRIASIQSLLVAEIEQAEYNREAIQEVIQEIRDSRRRDLIEQRYVHCVPVRIIAEEWNKSTDDIYKIIRKTIKKMEM
jgi:hypothetical protein